jgi:hypothetical protein
MCACDRDFLCPACAAREAAEWEPDTDAPPLDPDYLALFYGDEPARG